MSEFSESYGHGQDDSSGSAWAHVEAVRKEHQWRVFAIRMADAYLNCARYYAGLGPHNTGKATRLLVSSCEWFQRGSLTRQGQAAWRYAQWLHAGRFGGRTL